MNCRDVTEILDDQKIDGLDAAQRRQAEAHVAVCADCARAWHLQVALAMLPDMVPSADFPARCRALVAAGPRLTASARTGTRKSLVGALVALAAAAAMLAVLLRPTAPVAPAGAAQIAKAEASPPAVAAVAVEPAAELLPAVVVEAVAPGPQFTVRVVPYETPTNAQMAAVGLPEAQRLEIARADTGDPARAQALQSLDTALIAELHRIPGLTLVQSDPKEVTPSSRHYRLSIQALMVSGADAKPVPIDSRYVSTGVNVEQLQPGGKSVRRSALLYRIDLQAVCSHGAGAVDAPCYDVPGVASAMVQRLRREVFPPDPSVTRPLQAKFRDTSLDPAERLKALAELLKQQERIGDMGLLRDPGMVRAAIEMAANADPALRAQLWRSLRGVGDHSLVEPLITSMLQDPDDVRLAAIETLAADFSGDPRVRSALQSVAGGDPRPLVRAVAERGLSGEEGWRQYVVASLKDTSRSVPQRIEAMLYYLYPPAPEPKTSAANPDYFRNMKELLDDETVRALAGMLPDASTAQRDDLRNFVSNFGAQYSNNPAVTDMLLRYLDDADPWYRKVVVQPLAFIHGNEPRVHDALIKALNSDPDPGVRTWIRQVLGDKAP